MKIILNDKGELVTSVLGADGNPIVLNARESTMCLINQRKFNEEVIYSNALGYEVNISTLYAISKRVVEQRFFEIPPADYVPIRVGENAWSDNILTYREFAVGGDFEAGNLNTAANLSRLAETDARMDSITNKIVNWGKQLTWSFPDIQMAARSGNWDIIEAKERSRKKNWDLGIQQIAFYGSNYDPKVLGLYTQPNVNANTTLITGAISAMNAANFIALVQGLMQAYRANSNYTAWPNRLVIPEADYNGLATLLPANTGAIGQPMIAYLEQAFKLITRKADFQILPCAYGSAAQNAAIPGLNKNIYVLYNYDEDSLRMDIPVDYTNTMQNSINNFQWQNVGYGQYSGVIAYRPQEMLYFYY